jgi:hypothetical protein
MWPYEKECFYAAKRNWVHSQMCHYNAKEKQASNACSEAEKRIHLVWDSFMGIFLLLVLLTLCAGELISSKIGISVFVTNVILVLIVAIIWRWIFLIVTIKKRKTKRELEAERKRISDINRYLTEQYFVLCKYLEKIETWKEEFGYDDDEEYHLFEATNGKMALVPSSQYGEWQKAQSAIKNGECIPPPGIKEEEFGLVFKRNQRDENRTTV